jgi:hypothetical protein
MKHSFLIFIFLCLLGISSNAQPYQGPVRIENATDCEIHWDIVAICPGPPCEEYSTETANILRPRNLSATPPDLGWVEYTPDDYPWSKDPPPCSDWTWAYAIVWPPVDESCDAWPIIVGLNGVPDCNGDEHDWVTQFNCTCNGEIVTVSFRVANPGGVATLTITQ